MPQADRRGRVAATPPSPISIGKRGDALRGSRDEGVAATGREIRGSWMIGLSFRSVLALATLVPLIVQPSTLNSQPSTILEWQRARESNPSFSLERAVS